jgi:hypothetical protein
MRKRRAGATLFLGLLLFVASCTDPTGGSTNLRELVVQVGEGGRVAVRHDGLTEVCPSGQVCAYRLRPDRSVELRALPEGDYFFSGWVGDCSGYAPCSLDMAQNRRVEARFAARVGDFTLGPVPDPVVVPAGAVVEVAVPLQRVEGFNAPPEALLVVLTGPLVGDAVDQVACRYRPDRSGPDRLVLEFRGPEPKQVWTYLAAPARLSVKVGALEKTLDFILATTPCAAGCGG